MHRAQGHIKDKPEADITFCRHAGRSTINVSDVMLLARRNEGLESILRSFVGQQRETEAGSRDDSESG